MRRPLLWSVGLVYALAWFVQVIKDGDTLADGVLPGWQALHLALSPLWGDFDGGFVRGVLCVASGLSNLVFVLGFVQLARGRTARAKRWSWILLGATALNTFWIIDMAPPEDMRAGYWLWFASFGLLGLLARFSRADLRAAA